MYEIDIKFSQVADQILSATWFNTFVITFFRIQTAVLFDSLDVYLRHTFNIVYLGAEIGPRICVDAD